MKKLFSLFIVLIGLFSLFSCGGGDSSAGSHTDDRFYETAKELGFAGSIHDWYEFITHDKNGKPIEVHLEGDRIVWRYPDQEEWLDIYSIDDLTGTRYTVSFYVDNKLVKKELVLEGEYAESFVPELPHGTKFAGWLLDGKPFDFDMAITRDITLTTEIAREYTVTFVLASNEIELTVKAGAKVEAPEVPEEKGQIFVGWFDEANNEFDFNTPITGNRRITATYDVKKIELTLVVQGEIYKTQTINFFESYMLERPEVKGLVFKGWFTKENGLGEKVQDNGYWEYDYDTLYAYFEGSNVKYEVVGDHVEITGVNRESDSINITPYYSGLPVTTIRSSFGGHYLPAVSIPDTVTTIEAGALNSDSLVVISLPKSLATIGEDILNRDTLIYYRGSKEEFNKINIAKNNKGLEASTIIYNSLVNMFYDKKIDYENRYVYTNTNEAIAHGGLYSSQILVKLDEDLDSNMTLVGVDERIFNTATDPYFIAFPKSLKFIGKPSWLPDIDIQNCYILYEGTKEELRGLMGDAIDEYYTTCNVDVAKAEALKTAKYSGVKFNGNRLLLYSFERAGENIIDLKKNIKDYELAGISPTCMSDLARTEALIIPETVEYFYVPMTECNIFYEGSYDKLGDVADTHFRTETTISAGRKINKIERVNDGNKQYYLINDEFAYLIVMNITGTDLVLANEFKGKKLIGIGNRAFPNNSALETIELPDTLEVIGGLLFVMSGVTHLTIPDSVIFVGPLLCKYSGLKTLTLGKNVRYLGTNIIGGTPQLRTLTISPLNPYFESPTDSLVIMEKATKRVVAGEGHSKIPATAKILGAHSFVDASDGELVLPEGVEVIEDNVFFEGNITGLSIPSTVKYIHPKAFSFTNIEEISVASGNKFYNSKPKSNALVETSSKTLIALTKYGYVPEGVECIAEKAFLDFPQYLVLPKSVKVIKEFIYVDTFKTIYYAGTEEEFKQIEFESNGDLQSVEYSSEINKLEFTKNDKYAYLTNNKNEVILVGSKNKYQEKLDLITDFAGVNLTTLAERSIGSNRIECLSIPKTVTYIDLEFSNYDIKEVVVDPLNKVYSSKDNCIIETQTNTLFLAAGSGTVPAGIKIIGSYSFKYSFASNVILPEGVEEIKDEAFNDKRINYIELPKSLKKIGNNIFDYYSNLRVIYWGTEASFKALVEGTENADLLQADITYKG